MCPFLEDEEDDDFDDYQINSSHNVDSKDGSSIWGSGLSFLKDDKKFFAIGGAASIITFCVVVYVMYSNSRPIDLDDLPVIKADTTPIKIKPQSNAQVNHQDKIVYDNISGNKRANVVEKTLPQPEEVLSINEMDADSSLSEEEKKNIIQAFDALAPEKEYKINYIKPEAEKPKVESGYHEAIESSGLKIVENESPPLRIINPDDSPVRNAIKKQKPKRKEASAAGYKETTDSLPATGGSVMVQIASLPTKSSAEVEYKRLLHKNKFLKGAGKKIIRTDLGKSKGITYRIQVGPFKNSAEAQKVVSSMKNNGCFAYISSR